MSNLPVAAALAALFAVGCGPATAKPSACRAARAAYASLDHGTTYRRVVAILGCPGRQVTRMTIGKTVRATYTWRGTGTYGANLTIAFRNGHMTSKSQLGLK